MYRRALRLLSLCYLLAAVLHALDVFDLRLRFSEMGFLAQMWTVYMTLSDLLAALALWRATPLGDLFFILIVLTQLGVFVGWAPYLGNQYFVVGFHAVTLTVFLCLLTYRSRHMESKA